MERRYLRVTSSRPLTSVFVRSRGGSPKIQGYAAVFYDGTPKTEFKMFGGDLVERIMPGAFDKSLGRPDDVRGLFNHEPNNLLGRSSAGTLSLSTDAVGLRYTIDAGSTTVATDVVEHIQRGDLSGSSFAFTVTDQEFRTEDGVDIREIRGVELFDVGPVTYPAYDATTTGVRAVSDASACRAAYDDWKAERSTDIKAKNTQRLAMARARVRAIEISEQQDRHRATTIRRRRRGKRTYSAWDLMLAFG